MFSTSSSPIIQTPISALIGDGGMGGGKNGSGTFSRVELQPGIDLMVWEGDLREPISFDVHDDWHRINFSCALAGKSQFSTLDQRRDQTYQFDAGMSCISHTPDCRGQTRYAGRLESLFVSVDPALMAGLVPDMPTALRREIDSGRCYLQGQAAAELGATAQAMMRALQRARMRGEGLLSGHSRLWMQGQALVLASLAIESFAEDHAAPGFSLDEMRKLHRARDLLLADLTQAPTIAMLAAETGLPVMKLKRGFRQLFDDSVYGLFQRERMVEARRRLGADTPVMLVASDLGYTNASHFAAAFRKQFGIAPSALKRRM
jgi:AraC family transcriptional regulator